MEFLKESIMREARLYELVSFINQIDDDNYIVFDKTKKEKKKSSKRGSKYRGVSKNINDSWQLVAKENKKKLYLGSIKNEIEAA